MPLILLAFVSADESSGAAGHHEPALESGRSACLRSVKPAQNSGEARVVSWNVRWFPDGTYEDELSRTRATDVKWLACEMARLGAPVIAVQEFKKHARARAAAGELIAELDRLSGGHWRLELDECPGDNLPHLGFLFDERRVKGSDFASLDALNPHGGRCAKSEHPGWVGRFEFPGGLDLELVNVHAQAGVEASDLEARRRSYANLEQALREARARHGDRDVVFLGDFNTNGSRTEGRELGPAEEVAELRRSFDASELSLLEPDRSCSEYSLDRFWLLDHVAVPRGMRESRLRGVSVGGYCRDVACDGEGPLPVAAHRLSDHCPLIVSFNDKDLDERSSRYFNPN